jgi:tRNA U34 2-thiouridine synthase MnmA/TrmU
MPRIQRAGDKSKDQTYFIWQIKKEQLPHILFPVGEFDSKSEVREYAKSKGLITSDKPDSQGLCFVGQTSLRDMLLEVIGEKQGNIVTYITHDQIESIGLKLTRKNWLPSKRGIPKTILGKHKGAFLYTIGQRQNLGISNGPWFVSEVDIENNEVVVCHQNFDQAIEANTIIVKECNWHLDLELYKIERHKWEKELTNVIDRLDPKFNDFFNRINTNDESKGFGYFIIECECQLRYRSPSYACTIFYDEEDNQAFVYFKEPVKSIAKGQSAVFYNKECVLLGGSIIDVVV